MLGGVLDQIEVGFSSKILNVMQVKPLAEFRMNSVELAGRLRKLFAG
jgi:hypothetical protein